MGGRPRGPRGGRRRLGDRMPGSCRRLPPPRSAASRGAGPESSTPSSQVPLRSAHCPHHRSASPQPSSPQLPPAPPLAPRRHAPSLFSGCGAAPTPSPSGPLASPLTSPGVSSPEPRQPGSYLTLARSPGRRRAGTLGSLQVRGVNFGLSGSGNQNPGSLGKPGAVVQISFVL